jgi:glyoxylase-like metal-dependent hydrolase (beta-lactamase superfamily II)
MSGIEGRVIRRRSLLVHAGRGVLGLMTFGLAACSAEDELGDAGDGPGAGGPGPRGPAAWSGWSRVDFAYVSAYVLVRGGEAALVDVGLGDSGDQIGAVLKAAGVGWDDVRHVVVTHGHWDHFENLPTVADLATGATVHVGEQETFQGSLPPLHDVSDGEEVFGLQIVATPGHTNGHIAVFDPDSAVLVAGDALTNTFDGRLGGADNPVNVDPVAAADSVRKLAALEPRIILVGHGPPVQRNAANKLHALAESQ